jgi:hypothetical protein
MNLLSLVVPDISAHINFRNEIGKDPINSLTVQALIGKDVLGKA